MTTKVVNIHKKERCDVFIGRRKDTDFHFGNPYALGKSAVTLLCRPDRYSCLMAFYDWISGVADQHIEPERRQWILENLETLRGKSLGCFCHPSVCHGDIYRVLLGEATLDEVLLPIKPKLKPDRTPPEQGMLF